jgi:hypothetical protein
MKPSAIASIISVATAYCEANRLSLARVSTVVFNDGKALTRLAAGGDLTTRSFERAMAWFSANWPEGLAWPDGVERPASDAATADTLPAAAPATEGAAA